MAEPMAASVLNTQPEPAPLRQLCVLQVIPGDLDESAMIFAKRQAASLRACGLDSRVFFLKSRRSPVELVNGALRLRTILRECKPHLVHAHYGTMTAFLCSLLTTVPLVVTYRGSDLNPIPSFSKSRSWAGRLLSQLAALRATRIICVSDQLKNRLWWFQSKATVIPSGVDLKLFSPLSRDESRSALGWAKEERIVLFNGGRYPRIKRLDLAESAIEVAKTLGEEVRLIQLNGSIAPENVPLLLSAADCLLFTSDWEGSPNIVKEALACNLPIVSVDVGDVPQRLAKVSPSRIVSRDPLELGEALVEVLRQERRSNGREIINEISEDRVARMVYNVYVGILKEGNQSSSAVRIDPVRENACQSHRGV